MESHFDYPEPANGVMNAEQPPTDSNVFEDAAEVEVFYLEEQVLDSHFETQDGVMQEQQPPTDGEDFEEAAEVEVLYQHDYPQRIECTDGFGIFRTRSVLWRFHCRRVSLLSGIHYSNIHFRPLQCIIMCIRLQMLQMCIVSGITGSVTGMSQCSLCAQPTNTWLG